MRRLLIANRGEIARRIIRTAHRMGIETVAVYSAADRDAPHVREADAAVLIGPAPAASSYLDVDRVIGAVRASGADALHPGYGFLSENASFARACEAAGCTFVGPSAAVIEAMGSKIEAKRTVAAAGTPVVPGYQGDDQEPATLAAEAERIGWPLLIKASAGGGGKGMRRVNAAADFAAALASAKREASAAFGDDRVLLERCLGAPKHLEVQVLADAHGNVRHLFERDCSLQRRHQKVIEEAPGPTVDAALRRRLGEAAVNVAAAIGYRGAGTVEFIAENDTFYFMEMNTRLQVEHPVTELVLGIDLVEWQLRIAAGEAIAFAPETLLLDGHAIEARIYAENPSRSFLPSTGTLLHVRFPEDVRVDAGVETGGEVTVHYDPMLAKIVAHGRCRAAAAVALDRALAATELAGVSHNVDFLRRLLGLDAFRDGSYDTGTIERHAEVLAPGDDARLPVAAALARLATPAGDDPWRSRDAFRVNLPHRQVLRCRRGGEELSLAVTATAGGIEMGIEAGIEVNAGQARHRLRDVAVDGGVHRFEIDGEIVTARVVADGEVVHVIMGGRTEVFDFALESLTATEEAVIGDGRVISPMPGQVVAVHVREGERVERDQPLLVLEAMKMEHTITAPLTGVIARLPVSAGSRVDDGAELVVVEAAEE